MAASLSAEAYEEQLITEEYFSRREPSPEGSNSESEDSGSEDDHQAAAAFLEPRQLDVEEERLVNEFCEGTCKCQKKNGGPCSAHFSVSDVAEHRMRMAELEHDALDLVVLGQINAHQFHSGLEGHRATTERKKDYNVFYFHSHSVCLQTFLFLHGIGKKRFRNLVKHYRLNGVAPRTHGNYKRKPWHAATFEEKEHVVKFITNYAETHALPLPGRMPRFSDYNIMLLPSDTTKASVHREYEACCKKVEEDSGKPVRCFGYREFCRVWSEVVPYIRTMPPAEDICPVCQENAARIMGSANQSEDDKKQLLSTADEHLAKAKIQREHYRKQVESSKESINKGTVHCLSYSFDHAQQVHYPSNPQQPGPIYFKVPLKCGIFGVCDEGNRSQVNYLIDEAQTCGKGANTIISMVHHFLQHFAQNQQEIFLHADNCVGQNKNNAMIHYLAWRVNVGLSESCELSFMIPGHTKFSPDRFFGMIKRKYRRTRVNTLPQLAEMVDSSTVERRNTAYVIGHDDTKPFAFYSWTEHLQQSFSTVPRITTYHHFRFSKRSPGSVFVKQFADSTESEIKIAKVGCNLSKDDLPSILTPTGLSKERQVYLYEQIRPFCDAEYRDIVCPLPEGHISVQEGTAEDQDIAPPRSKRLCSNCRQPGHTKTKSGKITCPQLLKEL